MTGYSDVISSIQVPEGEPMDENDCTYSWFLATAFKSTYCSAGSTMRLLYVWLVIQPWIMDHVLPDGSFADVEHPVTRSTDGGRDLSFQWGIGPFIVSDFTHSILLHWRVIATAQSDNWPWECGDQSGDWCQRPDCRLCENQDSLGQPENWHTDNVWCLYHQWVTQLDSQERKRGLDRLFLHGPWQDVWAWNQDFYSSVSACIPLLCNSGWRAFIKRIWYAEELLNDDKSMSHRQ